MGAGMAQISNKFRNIGGGGLSYWCQGCKEMHTVWLQGHEPNDGRPRWSFNGDLEKPVFGPSVLVWWDEPANLGNPEQMQRDIEDVQRRRAAGETDARVPLRRKTCHTFVGCNGAQPGEVIFLSDCTHEFAGTVQPLPDLPPHAQGDRWSDGGEPSPPKPFTWSLP